MRIIVFTKSDEEVPQLPNRPNLECQHVRFDSPDLNDLLLVAEHRIIHFPTSLIVDDKGSVLMKIKGAIPDHYVDSLLKAN